MKQFNLEEYLKKPTRKVITRDGRSARIICTDAKGKYPVIALIEIENNNDEVISIYQKDGQFAQNDICKEDLFFAPEKHEGYVNVFKGTSNDYRHSGFRIYKSKEDAEEAIEGDSDYITTLKIEWEE